MAEKAERIGVAAFVVAGMSFVPLLGVLPGFVALLWGIFSKRRGSSIVAILGLVGISVTVGLYGYLFYMTSKDGVFSEMRTQLAQTLVTELVPRIELYKLQNGQYPESIEEIQESGLSGAFTSSIDPSRSTSDTNEATFFYQRNGDDTYHLFGLGADGLPFTDDDLLPEIETVDGSQIGYRDRPVARN
ncbi:MAG: type II secretion system protein GspG [Pseudomonadota bacterium]